MLLVVLITPSGDIVIPTPAVSLSYFPSRAVLISWTVVFNLAISGTAGNIFVEYICVYENTQAKYIWEKIGEVQTDVDLSGYVTTETFNQTINTINGQLANAITAQDVTTSDGSAKVVVNYTIPRDLYDSMVETDSSDQVIGG